jgi:hypothetical protein
VLCTWHVGGASPKLCLQLFRDFERERKKKTNFKGWNKKFSKWLEAKFKAKLHKEDISLNCRRLSHQRLSQFDMSDTCYASVSKNRKNVDIVDEQWMSDCLSDDGTS